MLMGASYLLQGATNYKTTSRILAALRGEAGEAAVLQARTMVPGGPVGTVRVMEFSLPVAA